MGGVGDEWSGWILGVRTDSPIKSAKELDGKKVGIASAGSGTDTLALWAQSEHKVAFSRIGVGGGGLVPNLLDNNLAAAVIYSPLSYQVVSEGEVRVLIDFATAMPPNLIGGWTATERNLTDRGGVHTKGPERPFRRAGVHAQQPRARHKAVRGGTTGCRRRSPEGNREDVPAPVRDGQTERAAVEKALELAAASGVKDIAPAAEVFPNMPMVPTKP